MDQATLYVYAGKRSVRGVQRLCVLRMVVKNNKLASLCLIDEEPPPGSLLVPVTFRIFRGMMQEHGLNFRRRKYTTEEEKRAAKRRSLEKYRQSPKYRTKQLTRRGRHPTPGVLTDQDVQSIKNSKSPHIAIARRYGISLRQVVEVLRGDWDAGGVLVGSEAVGAKQN